MSHSHFITIIHDAITIFNIINIKDAGKQLVFGYVIFTKGVNVDESDKNNWIHYYYTQKNSGKYEYRSSNGNADACQIFVRKM